MDKAQVSQGKGVDEVMRSEVKRRKIRTSADAGSRYLGYRCASFGPFGTNLTAKCVQLGKVIDVYWDHVIAQQP